MNVSDLQFYQYKAVVQKHIDGDTIEVHLSYGDHTYRVRRIRILGYDSPELFSGSNREAGLQAKVALAQIIPIGELVYIATQLDRQSFDRLLGTVHVADASGTELTNVADLMIAGGYGKASQ